MENAKILLKELKEVAKDVGVLDKSTKLRCVSAAQDPPAAQQPPGRCGAARARRDGSCAAEALLRVRLALSRCGASFRQ